MLKLASQDLIDQRVLLIENGADCVAEMTDAVEAAGGNVAGCVSSAFGAIAFVQNQTVDCVVVDIDTLEQIPFPLHVVLSSLGVALVPATLFDDRCVVDVDEGGVSEDPMVPAAA